MPKKTFRDNFIKKMYIGSSHLDSVGPTLPTMGQSQGTGKDTLKVEKELLVMVMVMMRRREIFIHMMEEDNVRCRWKRD